MSNKKMLCINMLEKNYCSYNHKCMYAHSLQAQKKEKDRKRAYDILETTTSLKDIDLIKDTELFSTLLNLTKVCILCSNNKCQGGYNCRNGAINNKYKVCYDDIMFGNCKKMDCSAVHLTDRGLIPKNIQLSLQYINDENYNEELDKITGILLTRTFLMTTFGQNDSDISETSEEIKKNKEYFDMDSDTNISDIEEDKNIEN